MRRIEFRILIDEDIFDDFLSTIPLDLLGEQSRFGYKRGVVWIGGNRGIANLFRCSLQAVRKVKDKIRPAIYKDGKGLVWLNLMKALPYLHEIDDLEEREKNVFRGYEDKYIPPDESNFD